MTAQLPFCMVRGVRLPFTSDGDAWSAPAAVVAAAVGLAGIAAADGRAARLEVAAFTAVTIAGFAARARWRVPTAVLGVWTFAPAVILNLRHRGEGTMFLLVVAVGFLVLVTPDRRARTCAGVVAVLAPPAVQAVRPQDWGWQFWMMGIAFGWLSSEQMRKFRDMAAELAVTRGLLAEQAVHVERRRIAAEIHDLVGHSLTVVLLSITGARRLVHDDPGAATEALLEAEAIGRASLAEIRSSARALRDDGRAGAGVDPMPAAGDVPELVERMVTAGSVVDLDVTGDITEVEPVTGLVVYRVVQESLANAARHAPGASARVSLAVTTDSVEVSVFDGGVDGRNGSGSPGVGLIGMRERVEAVGGTLQAGPVTGGWRVWARLPRTPTGST
jgi:signal transduction histidine kinase